MAQFITAQEAAKLIPDGAIVGIAGMGLSGWAEEVGRANPRQLPRDGAPVRPHPEAGLRHGRLEDARRHRAG